MSAPIYLLVQGGFTDAWYALSADQQQAIWSQVEAADREAGMQWIISCDSRWADESVPTWGVLEYPSMDAYLKKVAALEQIGWWRYFAAKTILGTKRPG